MSMGKWFVLAAALVAIGVPAALAASPDKEKPVTAAQSQSAERAAKACKAERQSMGIEAFAKRYGTNHNLRNAFGKCASSKAIAKARRPSSSNGLIGGP
jgi:hypothetical protein